MKPKAVVVVFACFKMTIRPKILRADPAIDKQTLSVLHEATTFLCIRAIWSALL